MKEQEIRRQFRDAVRTQEKQYKLLKETVSVRTPKTEQKAVFAKLKEDQVRRMAMLGSQYEHSIDEVTQHQNVSKNHVCVSLDQILKLSANYDQYRPIWWALTKIV